MALSVIKQHPLNLMHIPIGGPQKHKTRISCPLVLADSSLGRICGGNPHASQNTIEIWSSDSACLMPSANLSGSMAFNSLRQSLLQCQTKTACNLLHAVQACTS